MLATRLPTPRKSSFMHPQREQITPKLLIRDFRIPSEEVHRELVHIRDSSRAVYIKFRFVAHHGSPAGNEDLVCFPVNDSIHPKRPESDIDIRGVAIMRDLSYYYGWLNTFSQYEDKVNDIVIYDIRKAFNLISACNPNMLDFLYTMKDFLLSLLRIGKGFWRIEMLSYLRRLGIHILDMLFLS